MIDNSQINWPKPPNSNHPPDDKLNESLYTAQLQYTSDVLTAWRDRDKAVQASYDTINQSIINAYIDVAKGQLDRSMTRAEFIEKAAGTIAGFYTGILGLIYSIDKNANKPFPAVGIAPTIFLGLSIVLATFYLAYIKHSKPVSVSQTSGLIAQQIINDRDDFITWTSNAVLKRAQWLQSAVICLGFGIVFLPAVFIVPTDTNTSTTWDIYIWIAVAVGLALTFLPVLLPRPKGNQGALDPIQEIPSLAAKRNQSKK